MSSQWPGSGDYWGVPQQPGWDGGYSRSNNPWQPPAPPEARYPGFPPPAPGLAPGPPPAKGNTVLALIIAIIVTLSCCGFTNITGIVFASIALSKEQEPEELEKFTRWAWLCNFIHIGILVFVVVLFLTLRYV